MSVNIEPSLQSVIMKILANPNAEKRIGTGEFSLDAEVKNSFPEGKQPASEDIAEVVWTMAGSGLAFIDMSKRPADYWRWRLTRSGRKVAQDERFNPDDPQQYLERLKATIPDLSSVVFLYIDQAINCYVARCYLASAVMLGVASEAAFLEMAHAATSWLPGTTGENLKKVLENPRQNYIDKFREFRKRIESEKNRLPAELTDNMALNFDAVLDALRIYRNEAGHPTGKIITREDQYISLHMFARYLLKMYQFRNHFIANSTV